MQLSWFRKPIYKIVYGATILGLISCGLFIWYSSSGWVMLFSAVLLPLIILIGSSFIVCSGVYVTAICKGNDQKNKIAITFDDGPNELTREILNILDKYQVKASFFLIGRNVLLNKDIVFEIAQKKHSIGNHSFNHKSWFPIIGVKKIEMELRDTQNAIGAITGSKPVYFRPPFGITNPFIANALKYFNFKIIGWSVRSLDTVIDDPEKIIKRIKKQIGPGSIVLMHDTSINVTIILEWLLIYCKQINLMPVCLDELLEN
jgi:peptidoglycan-N-acetylglucosamine deacetylase